MGINRMLIWHIFRIHLREGAFLRGEALCVSWRLSVLVIVDSVPYGWNMRNHLTYITPKYTNPHDKHKTPQENVTSALYRTKPR